MTRKVYTPRPFAPLATEFIAGTPRCALFAGMGMGKTTIVETYLDACYNVMGETAPTLVIAPRRVAHSTWTNEAAKWEHLSGLEIATITGTAEERHAALRRDVPVHTINYENLPWLLETVGARWRWRRLVPDESTRLKSFRLKQGGARARALGRVAHTLVAEVIELTGTPTPQGLIDLWGQMWFLDSGKRLGRTFSAFMERWFQSVPGGDGYSQVKPLPFAQEQIQDAIADICLTLDPRDWFNIKDPIINVIKVQLPPKVRQRYKEMEKDFFTQIGHHDIEAVNAAGKSCKLLQLASGAMYVDPDADSDEHPKAREWVEVHDLKLQALESVVTEAAGMPVIVAYHFKSDRARILKAFKFARAIDSARDEEDFKAGKILLAVVHAQSIGHGVDGFQNVTNQLVFFTEWWALEPHLQIIERIGPVRQLQAGFVQADGFNRPVFVHCIVAEDTIDETVLERHSSKRGVMDLLLDYMKRRKR